MQIDSDQLAVDTETRLIEEKANYTALWAKLVAEWRSENSVDKAWLTYSANYLLYTAGVKWAIDPFALSSRVEGVPQPDYARDLQGLELVVLTHEHNDHLDRNLVNAVKDLPINWVIPGFLEQATIDAFQLPRERVITPVNGRPIQYRHLTLTPFNALHFRGVHGVPETGYLAEFNHKRWLFPGDTRTYDRSALPEFGDLDGAVAHLWLGKTAAQNFPPRLLEDFCAFFAGFKARRLVITHLYEHGRDASDLWTLEHFAKVQEYLQRKHGCVPEAALTGASIAL